MRGMWGPRPTETVEKGNEALDGLVKVLESRGVKVDRPTPLQWNAPVITPDFRTDSMMTCMPAPAALLTIGNEIIETYAHSAAVTGNTWPSVRCSPSTSTKTRNSSGPRLRVPVYRPTSRTSTTTTTSVSPLKSVWSAPPTRTS